MKYMIMVFGSDYALLQTRPPEWIKEMIQFMNQVNEDLAKAGELVTAHGLADGSQAKTIRIQNGVPAVTDGPYAESKESLAGYWVVDVESEARALEIASRVVAFIGPVGAPPVEVRRIGEGAPGGGLQAIPTPPSRGLCGDFRR